MGAVIFSQFDQSFLNFGPRIPGLIFYLVLGWLVIKVVVSILRNSLRIARVPKALSNIVVSLCVAILWIILLSELARQAGLSSLAVKISGSLLVLGLAVANGAAGIAGDILSGLFLARDKDFEVGYRIKSGEIEGVIKKIDIRKTRIEDKGGKLFIVPNSKIDAVGWQVLQKGD